MIMQHAGNFTGSDSRAATQPSSDGVAVEKQLVRQALEGNGEAFSRLVRPHLDMLFRVAARCCAGDTQLAEDAVQETLTLAYERLHTYTPGTSLKAFMASIAARRAHTLIRAERRRRVREETARAPERSATPEQLASAEQTRAAVFAALQRMPQKRREAALLRLECDMSYAEIAQSMGSTEGSTRVLVHLALKELKACLRGLA